MKIVMGIKSYLHKLRFYSELRFRILVVKYILFKSLPSPPQADYSGKIRVALNGRIKACDERFFEVRDLLLDLDSKNKKISQMKIGGNSFTTLEEIKTLAQKQRQNDSQKHTDAADLTINHPVLIRRVGDAGYSIAFSMYHLCKLHALLQTYGLQPEQVTVIFWPHSHEMPNLKFRAFYEKMFGGIEFERIYDKPPQKILLKRALVHTGSETFAISPSVPALRDWMTRSFQIKVKTETHKVKKIVFVDRQPMIHNGRIRRARVISNMDELCDAIQVRYPTLSFMRVRLELLSIADQIELLADADIVIGAHGAGLVFAANLVPENAGIIELLPAKQILFHALHLVSGICRARGVHHELRIQLRKKRRISKHYAERYGPLDPEEIVDYFPPEAIIEKIAKITQRIEESPS